MQEFKLKYYKKILLVEDGSVDIDALSEDLAQCNPEIKIIVYRQGSPCPQIIDIDESDK